MTSNTQALLAGGTVVPWEANELESSDITRFCWSLLVISMGVLWTDVHRLFFGRDVFNGSVSASTPDADQFG
jgi:hypothetical protein